MQGVRYEKKVHEYFTSLFPDHYVSNPWVTFQVDGAARPRWCQPDGLLIDVQQGLVTIVEVKYQHTSDAWWQLEMLYKPVLRAMFPRDLWQFRCVEVVKWFDPAVAFPVPARLSESPAGVGDLSVHIWRPGDEQRSGGKR
jgi:hypothetical protein